MISRASKRSWPRANGHDGRALLVGLTGEERFTALNLFDQMQLAAAIRVCREHSSLSAAGRALFTASRAQKASANDADRLRKYLARFGLDWQVVSQR